MKFGKLAITSLSAAAAMMIMTGCDNDNSKEYTYDSSGPALEIEAPSITVTGVLQDKNGNPLANQTVYLGEKTDTTNDAGIFTFTSVKITSGVDLDLIQNDEDVMDGASSTKSVHIVIPSIADANGTVTHLGATATVDIDQYLLSVYSSTDQTYYTSLDGHTIYAGAIQLPQLGASVTARLEAATTEAPVGGTAYFTVNNEAVAGTSGVEFGNTGVNYSAVSYVEQIFTTDVNSTNGMFTVTGLPFNSAMDLIISGYAQAANVFTTYDDTVVNYQTADIALTPINLGDTGALEFSNLVGAVGNDVYNFTLNNLTAAAEMLDSTTVTNYIAPSTTLTLKFNEAIDTTKVDSNSIKYVRTLSQEQLNTISEINTLLDTQNTNEKTLLSLIDTLYAEQADLLEIIDSRFGVDLNTTELTTLAAALTDYNTALNAVVTEANATTGDDVINTLPLTYYKDDDANATDSIVNISAGNNVDTDFAIIDTAITSSGVELTARRAYLDTLQAEDNYVEQNISTVATSGDDTVVITLGATLPINNIVQIGLKTFDFSDAAGNLLTTNRTGGGSNLTTDDSTSYVTQISVGTAE